MVSAKRIQDNRRTWGFKDNWQAEQMDRLWGLPMSLWPAPLFWFVLGYMRGKAYCGELHATAIAEFLKTPQAKNAVLPSPQQPDQPQQPRPGE